MSKLVIKYKSRTWTLLNTNKLPGLNIISLQEFNNISCDHDSVVEPPPPPLPHHTQLPQLVRERPSLSRGETKGERSDRLGIRERGVDTQGGFTSHSESMDYIGCMH